MAYYFTQDFNEEEVLTTFELLKKQFPVQFNVKMAYYFTQDFNEEEVLTTFELLKNQFPVQFNVKMAYYFTQDFNEEEVLTTFELLKKQFPVLPPTISVTAVLALCRTSQWRTSLELVESMRGMNTPLPPAASIDMFYCFLPSL